MDEFLVTVLTSTVISSLITVLSNVLLNQKKNSLEYITNERKLWRQEIREIAVEIEKSDESNINIPLTKLKVRINAYDYFKQNQQDSGDYVLWQLIDMLEESGPSMHKFIKKNLLMLISLMLKYDWERSKKEIKINKTNVLMHFCSIIQIIAYLLLSRIFNFSFMDSAIFALIYTIVLLVINILIGNEAIKRQNKFRICSFFFGLFYGATIGLFYGMNLIMVGEAITNIFQKIFLGSVVMLPTGFWLFFAVKKNALEKYRYDYVKSLSKITKDLRTKVNSISPK